MKQITKHPKDMTPQELEAAGIKLKPFKRKDEAWHERERAKPIAPKADRKRRRFCITVPDIVMHRARRIGKGNASRGIEVAVEECLQHRRRK